MDAIEALKLEARHMSVLYVEDEEIVSKQIGSFLKKFFKDVVIAKNGFEGVSTYKQNQKDIVISDIAMPIMNGIDMARAIKSFDPNVKLIFTTAHTDQEFLLNSIDIGVVQYITKPIEFKAFIDVLLKLTKNIRKEKYITSTNKTIRQIVNALDGLILVYSNNVLILANHGFLKFIGLNGLKDLRDVNFNFTSIIAQEEGFIFSDTITGLFSVVNKSQEQDRRIKLIGKNMITKVFTIDIKELADGETIIVLNQVSDTEDKLKMLEMLSIYDPLTKIYNKYMFDKLANNEIELAKQEHSSLTLIRFDIDNLGAINELYGVDFGDRAILHVCHIVKNCLCNNEIFARESQDEFLILCTKLTLSETFMLAETIRKQLEQTNFEDSGGGVTCSFGVVHFEILDAYQEFLANSMRALGLAKIDRNCIRMLDSVESIIINEIHASTLKVLLDEFDNLRLKQANIAICAFYKGLVISQDVTIAEVSKTAKSIKVVVPGKKLHLFSKIGKVYLKIEDGLKSINCSVAGIIPNSSQLELNEFVAPTNSPTDRKLLRLDVEEQIDVKIEFIEQVLIATLLDISADAMKVAVHKLPNMPVGVKVEVSFSVNINKTVYNIMGCAKIIKSYFDKSLDKFTLVLSLCFDYKTKNSLMKYISDLQMEVIREMNKNLKE